MCRYKRQEISSDGCMTCSSLSTSISFSATSSLSSMLSCVCLNTWPSHDQSFYLQPNAQNSLIPYVQAPLTVHIFTCASPSSRCARACAAWSWLCSSFLSASHSSRRPCRCLSVEAALSARSALADLCSCSQITRKRQLQRTANIET